MKRPFTGHVGRALIALFGLLWVAGGPGMAAPKPAGGEKEPVYVMGTRTRGSNLTEPKPRESKFFHVEHAGFVVLEQGAAYYLLASVRQAPAGTNYIRVEYENPKEKGKPFINDMELTPDMDGVRFSSPDVVWGIRNYKEYTIKVSVFARRGDTNALDTLVQPVRAYVDTTTSKVRIYGRMRAK